MNIMEEFKKQANEPFKLIVERKDGKIQCMIDGKLPQLMTALHILLDEISNKSETPFDKLIEMIVEVEDKSKNMNELLDMLFRTSNN